MNDSFLQSIRDYRQYGRMDFWSPKEIEEYLHENGGVVGQDAACRAAALITYNHFEGRPSVNLFHGTTGCGKTFIWEQMKEYLGPRIVIVDGSTLTGEGWKGGNKLSTIFRHMRPDDRSKSIIVFDEFDKVLEPQYGDHHKSTALSMQPRQAVLRCGRSAGKYHCRLFAGLCCILRLFRQAAPVNTTPNRRHWLQCIQPG